MQKWEYRPLWTKKTDAYPRADPEKPYWISALDELGKQGWEAVGLAVADEHIVVLLKRLKT